MLHWLPPIRDKLETLCADWMVPLAVAAGWIEVESGGRLDETTSLGERGYFQISPDESAELGMDHQRLSTDSDYSLNEGLRLTAYYRGVAGGIASAANAPAITTNLGYLWRMAKFNHCIGMGAAKIILTEAARQGASDSWMAFCDYCRDHNREYLLRLQHSPVKWFGQVDRMFAIARQIGPVDLVCGPPDTDPNPNVA